MPVNLELRQAGAETEWPGNGLARFSSLASVGSYWIVKASVKLPPEPRTNWAHLSRLVNEERPDGEDQHYTKVEDR